ncbi:General alpha-glucoside permease, partial [Pseudocercospora fuligena]
CDSEHDGCHESNATCRAVTVTQASYEANRSLVPALAKLCNGAGIGVLQIVCQVYIMEICPNRIRGGMVVFQQVWSCIGGIIVAVMMQQLNKKHPNNYLIAMRILWAPIAFMIVCWAFVPESPWHHARKGDKEMAMKALKRLFGGIEGYDFEEEYAIIARTIEHEKAMNEEKPRFRDVFRGLNLVRSYAQIKWITAADRPSQKRASIVIILSISQQLAGLAIISTYSTYFFSLAGLDDPFLGTLILQCCNLLAVLSWSLTADYLGRRLTVNSCQTLVCVILVIVGSLYWTGATDDNAAAGTALIVAISYYLYSAELPTALLRIKTGPITYATPPMLLHLSLRAAFVYFAFSVPICIIMWLYVPETKGRSAAEIDELYERKVPAWRWASTRTAAEDQMEAVVQVKGRVKQA